MDRPILYSSIEDISIWSKTKMIDSDCHFCIRIVTNECIYFFKLIHFIYEINGSIQFNGKYVKKIKYSFEISIEIFLEK